MEQAPKKLWFKAKRYGYGWTPCSMEGALVLLLYIWSGINIFILIDSRSHSGSDTLISFAPVFLALTLMLYTICVWKGEKPRWRWGGK
ncbi:MAG: hypothetical protein V4438_03355 [Patescibacteria group bacterium]